MKNKLLNLIFILLLITCNSVENDNPDNDHNYMGVAHLCVNSNEVLGWNVLGDTCQVYAKECIYGSIDGAAGQYLENGLVEYSFYSMVDSSDRTVEILVLNMGTSKNSATMFSKAKNELTDSLSLKNYSGSTAIIGVFGIGTVYELYAKLKYFYFKLTFLKIADNSEAIKISETFMNVFQTKLKSE